MPDEVDPRDEQFDPRRGPIYVRGDAAEPKRKVLSWLRPGESTGGSTLSRVLNALALLRIPATCCSGAWGFLESWPAGWRAHPTALGVVARSTHAEAVSGGATVSMYRCEQCRRLSVRSGGSAPPWAVMDPGPLPVPDSAEDDEHYRQLYRSLNPVPLRAIEHTAQWTI